MTTPILGIDIAKATLQVCLVRPEQPSRSREFSNDPVGFTRLHVWLSEQAAGQVQACLEATGRYGDALAVFLHAHGHAVSRVNPARVAAYARSQLARTKTDAVDAALIADFCRTQQPRLWPPPSAELQELQTLVRHVDALQQMHTQESNRLDADPPAPTVRQLLQTHLRFLEDQLADLQAQITAHVQAHAELEHHFQLLLSIPGIGAITAARLVAENLPAFDDARAVAAYAGLSPAIRQSGSSVRHKTQLCKLGNERLRKALYFPALSALRHNPLIRAFADRLRARGKAKMVIVGAAMRKLLCLAYGVLKSGVPFDPHFAQSLQVLA